MILPFVAMVSTAILFGIFYLIAFLIFFFCFKKTRSILSIILLVALAILYYPASDLMFEYIYNSNTHSGHSDNHQNLPSELSQFSNFIPEECSHIIYHFAPGNGWFSCQIPEKKFNDWITLKEFSPKSDISCFGAEEKQNELFSNSASIATFSTAIESNGAGKVAFYSSKENKLLACEWYW